jgi:ribosomal-protein-serine acetyltransferase
VAGRIGESALMRADYCQVSRDRERHGGQQPASSVVSFRLRLYGGPVHERLPERLVGSDGLVLRRWVREDAAQLVEAVSDSLEHLRPWMPWIANEPSSVEDRRALIETWHEEWLAGGDLVLGMFVDGAVAGGCGLHHRIGPGGLEIGYWTARRFLRQGIATRAAALLTDAAFAQPGIDRVEIHHDQANVASGGVPRRLGFRLVRTGPDEIQAPGESGISCEWQITREEWRRR